jgi:hypothetical protein
MGFFQRFLSDSRVSGCYFRGCLQFGFRTMALLLLLCAAAGGANAQGDVKVLTRASASHITIGDQFRVFVEAQYDTSKCRLEWANIPDSVNSLEIVERGKIDTQKNGSVITCKQRLLVTGFDSGAFVFPSLSFTVQPKDGGAQALQYRSDSFVITVQTVAVDTTKEFKPIKGIIFVKASWTDYIWYIIGGILLLAAVIAGTVYFLKKNKKEVPVPQLPKETANEKALRRLADLEKRQLWQNDKIKEYYVELSDIVRSYVEDRFHTPALELTTDELLQKVQYSKDMQQYYQQLSTMLTTADLAKFAKAKPMPEEHILTMQNAVQFVEISKPIVEPPTQPTV